MCLVGKKMSSIKLSKTFIKSVFFILAGLLPGYLLSGCAGHLNEQQSDDYSAADELHSAAPADKNISDVKSPVQQSDAETVPETAPETKVSGQPEQELTSQLLYDLMLAELSQQRGDYNLAFEKYYTAAIETRDSRIARKAARAAIVSKNDEQTFKAVELWSQLQPDNIDVLQVLASSQLSRKQDEEAIASLQKMLNLTTDFEEGFKRISETLNTIDERERAENILIRLTRNHKDERAVKLYQAKLAIKHGDFADAEKYLDEILTIDPDSIKALRLKVELLKKQKNTAAAINVLQKLLHKLPENLPLRLELARMLVENKSYKQAFKQVQILAKKDLSPEVLFAVSLLAIEMDKLDAAKQYLQRLYAYRLYASEAAYFIAQLEAGRENYAEAEQWFKRVQHGKYTFEAYLGLVVVYSQQKKFDQAFKLLEHSNADNDKQSIALLQIKAEVYAQAKQYKTAYGIYTKALNIAPDNSDLLYGRAMLAEKFDRIDLLEKDLHTIIKSNPKDNQALNALGYTLADRTERYQEAHQYIVRAFKINPQDTATLDSMGWILHKLGKDEEAVVYLRQAYNKDPDPEIAAHLGEVLWVLGKTTEATAIWQKALEKDPEHQVLVSITTRYLK